LQLLYDLVRFLPGVSLSTLKHPEGLVDVVETMIMRSTLGWAMRITVMLRPTSSQSHWI
jgi:hypothetical protein